MAAIPLGKQVERQDHFPLIWPAAFEIGVDQPAIADAEAHRQLIPPLRIEIDLGAEAAKCSVIWLPIGKEVRSAGIIIVKISTDAQEIDNIPDSPVGV